ncbi:SRPBCC family protein [Pseudoxanthomonas sacheonensis]|uniref:Uncharacterized protein YndB with AHSA1/START domain n=1 Tax=Pseudoxanthomonas sacheonensis TaxID=443615 RepID=A0ABU1RSJ1_9GAMM|nr:SRPBCC domain-containing protein [Pseudoxanthomonas sacheonensis]MDR6841733.1 uncharacterized protein YndB with AHSA1/START domain [Pseudoxanthomonas sacheonensis]
MQSFEQTIFIAAPANAVWESLTQSQLMKEWMGEPEMAIEVETDWTVGGPIVVRGFHHVPFENTGAVLEFEPRARLAYTHLSSLSRLPDVPENHTTLEFTLESIGDTAFIAFAATGFPSDTIFKHLQFYWSGTLEILKQHVERRSAHDANIGA